MLIQHCLLLPTSKDISAATASNLYSIVRVRHIKVKHICQKEAHTKTNRTLQLKTRKKKASQFVSPSDTSQIRTFNCGVFFVITPLPCSYKYIFYTNFFFFCQIYLVRMYFNTIAEHNIRCSLLVNISVHKSNYTHCVPPSAPIYRIVEVAICIQVQMIIKILAINTETPMYTGNNCFV